MGSKGWVYGKDSQGSRFESRTCCLSVLILFSFLQNGHIDPIFLLIFGEYALRSFSSPLC